MSRAARIRIWDLPTRLFHWLLLVCIVGLIITGKVGNELMVWHFRLGFCVMTLLLFRIIWGFVGGKWSRFATFIYAPGTVLAYLKGQGKPEHSAGHNPLGAGSVFALLLILMAQVGSGLISDDEITNQGPLARFVSGKWVSLANWWHKDIGQYALFALVALHVAAILFYLLKRQENLIAPMIQGDKELPQAVEAAQDGAANRIMALVILALSAGFVYWVQSLGATAF